MIKIMIEIIIEMITYIFVEIIFQKFILGFFRVIQLIGLLLLKLITLNNKPIDKLKEKYEDSSKPYLLGFGFVIGIVYIIVN